MTELVASDREEQEERKCVYDRPSRGHYSNRKIYVAEKLFETKSSSNKVLGGWTFLRGKALGRENVFLLNAPELFRVRFSLGEGL